MLSIKKVISIVDITFSIISLNKKINVFYSCARVISPSVTGKPL